MYDLRSYIEQVTIGNGSTMNIKNRKVISQDSKQKQSRKHIDTLKCELHTIFG